MPVMAKLSLKFYERFGEDIANELVGLFNEMDATYRTDLRELNELNFARFIARMDQGLTEADAKWERRLADLEVRITTKIADAQVAMATKLNRLALALVTLWITTLLGFAGIFLR